MKAPRSLLPALLALALALAVSPVVADSGPGRPTSVLCSTGSVVYRQGAQSQLQIHVYSARSLAQNFYVGCRVKSGKNVPAIFCFRVVIAKKLKNCENLRCGDIIYLLVISDVYNTQGSFGSLRVSSRIEALNAIGHFYIGLSLEEQS